MTIGISIGIIGIEYQLPHYKVCGSDIAKYLGWDVDKIRIGLGMMEIGAPGYTEDVVSLALSAVKRLCLKYKVEPGDVGKIEVGTESHFDAAKSIKTYLMDLFPGNTNIGGCDTTNACYGGTNALLNCVAWMESSLNKHKYAIVVCTDISVYDSKPAIPTSGAGAVAMLIGPDPVYKFMPGSLFSYSSNEKDFLKHRSLYFPYIDGKKSIEVYNAAFDAVYSQYVKYFSDASFDHICFHAPYPKLVTKICKAYEICPDKYEGSLLASQYNGNTYTASLYFSFISTLFKKNIKVGETIALFSFGSGCVASLYCLKKVRNGMSVTDFGLRLNNREAISMETYLDIVKNMSLYKVQFDKQENIDGYSICEESNYFRRYMKPSE